MRRLEDIALERKDRDAIELAVRRLCGRFPVDKVVLFGSKVRGTDDEESDIDLLVLTREPLSWKEQGALTDLLFEVGLEHEVVISALVVPRGEWETGLYRVLPIHEEVERDGVVA